MGGGSSHSGSSAPSSPKAYTGIAVNITPFSAVLNGAVNPNGTPTIAQFQVGLTSTSGIETNILNVGAGAGTVNINSAVVSLTPFTTYYYKVKASNSVGVVSGTDMAFNTPLIAPSEDQLMVDEGNTPEIAMSPDSTKLYVVYEGKIGNGYGITFKKSLNGGQSFGSKLNVSPGADGDFGEMPAMAVDSSGYIHVVYCDEYNIYYAKSTDLGNSFSVPILINGILARGKRGAGPRIATTANRVYVVWDSDEANSRIYMDKSYTNAYTFSADKVVSSPTTGIYVSPFIVTDENGYIYVVWQGKYDINEGNHKVYFSRSTDGGTNFISKIRVDDNSSAVTSSTPRVAVAGGNVYVVWEDNRANNADIRVRKSTDNGSTFTSPSIKINDDGTTRDQKFPSVRADTKGTVYVAWQDFRNSPDTPDIYYAYASTTNGGQLAFSANTVVNSIAGRLPSGSGYGGYTSPALAISQSNIYVVWRGWAAGYSTNSIYLSR